MRTTARTMNMKTRIVFGVCGIFLAVCIQPDKIKDATSAQQLDSSHQPQVNYEKNIAPMLARSCEKCHNDENSLGGLDLSQFPFHSARFDGVSAIVQAMIQHATPREDGEVSMPMQFNGPTEPLSSDELQLLQLWLDLGLPERAIKAGTP